MAGLGRHGKLDRRDQPQAVDDGSGLVDDLRRHRRVVLDRLRDRLRIQHGRVGEMADLGEQRGQRLLHGCEAGMRTVMRRELQRQIGEAGREQPDDAAGREPGRLRQAEAERLEGQRESGRMEVAGRDRRSRIGKDERAVGGGIQLGLHRLPGARERVQRGAVHRGDAAEAQGILEPPGGVRLPQGGVGKQAAEPRRGFDLARARPRLLDRREERSGIGPEAFEAERRCGFQCGESLRGIAAGERSAADAGRIGADQREPILGREDNRLQPGSGQRLAAGQHITPVFCFPLADERQGHMSERRQVGGADRAGCGDQRMHAGVQHGNERLQHAG
jgi:hypothetical protein